MQEQEHLQQEIQEELKRKNWWVTNSCPSGATEIKRCSPVRNNRINEYHHIKSSKKTTKQDLLHWLSSESFIEFIDSAALVVFPVSFALFQTCYWLGGVQESGDLE